MNRLDIPGQGQVPLDMYNFTQVEYNANAVLIERTPLIPEFCPLNWMQHIDRYQKSLHPHN